MSTQLLTDVIDGRMLEIDLRTTEAFETAIGFE